MAGFSKMLEGFAKEDELAVEWQYLNYVDGTQDPLKIYGAENAEFLRSVAGKYDPMGVFQEKVVSGWKISRVDV